MISELEIRHLTCIYSYFIAMTLTLQHPKALRIAFLINTELDNLKSFENIRSVFYYDSNDDKEFKKLPNIKVVLKYC